MNYVNYILTILGVFMIIISLILIIADKIKGENIYYNMYIKEQDLKKAIKEAEEIMNELVYTSESIIGEIENSLYKKRQYKNEIETYENKVRKEIISTNVDDNDDDNIETKNYKSNINISKIEESYSNGSQLNEKSSKKNEVKKLLEQGMAIEDIAKKLNIGKGEVLLISSLSKRDNE